MSMVVQQMLESGLSEMGLGEYQNDIQCYVALLQRWNKAYNLIARVDDEELLKRHIFDCLAVRPFIQKSPCLDVGSGAGLPGLLLAVTMPATEWVILDSNGKKTRFCEQAAQELGLTNVRVVQQRIADHKSTQGYATIISRAYAQADDFVRATRHLLSENGQILAMKGRIGMTEQVKAKATGLYLKIEPMVAPEQVGQRHMMIFSNYPG